MSPAPSTILITGGGSGIGAAMAAAFHARGAKVIIAGKTQSRLEAVAARYPGMETEIVDVADAAQVAALAMRIGERHPQLDTVINNAGIQNEIDFTAPGPIDPHALTSEVDVNLKGLLYVSNALLPLLKVQPKARLVHVGSGLGYAPLAATPVYSATKAAVHSFTISLRRQLRGSTVAVIEIIPPAVQTDLHRRQARMPPGAMPIDAFVKAAMAGLDAGKLEINVGLVKVLSLMSRIAPAVALNIINKQRN